MIGRNKCLNNAKKDIDDEYYTQMVYIEDELKHYKRHFKGKVVYCSCDGPESNFAKYFKREYDNLGLKGLNISNGLDFRSPESVAMLEQSDIVVTNPPYSLFRLFFSQLIQHKKQFLIVGSFTGVTYRAVFLSMQDGVVMIGASGSDKAAFDCPDGKGGFIQKVAPAIWFSTLDSGVPVKYLELTCKYNAKDYPKYDNYDAINVNSVKEIPCDYEGVMGVPITVMRVLNREQFELIGCTEDCGPGLSAGLWFGRSNPNQSVLFGEYTKCNTDVWNGGTTGCMVDGVNIFKRIFIKRRKR